MIYYSSALEEYQALPAEMLAPRSPQWASLRDRHLEKEGWCRFCGSTECLEVHHVRPVHLFPKFELDPRNLITLCMNDGHQCHLRVGHLGSWFKWNRFVRAEAKFPAPVPTEQRALAAALAAQGGWAFGVERDGDDLVVRNARATCFGGAADPQDNGQTASGFSTRAHPDSAAVSLPMDGLQFKVKSEAFHRALDGSPIPRLPWLTQVVVQVGLGPTARVETFPVIDLGPAKYTGNAIDLTVAAARRFDPMATATDFAATVFFRILRGALYLPRE